MCVCVCVVSWSLSHLLPDVCHPVQPGLGGSLRIPAPDSGSGNRLPRFTMCLTICWGALSKHPFVLEPLTDPLSSPWLLFPPCFWPNIFSTSGSSFPLACPVTQSCPTLCSSMDCSLPSSSVHGLFQARILEWVAMSSGTGSFRPRDWTHVSYVFCMGRQILYHCTILHEMLGKKLSY